MCIDIISSMTRYCHSRCASLPRVNRTLSSAETACPECGGELSALSCDVSEQLELISRTFKVIEMQPPKLACGCDHIVQAPIPLKSIEQSYAGPGLLARIVTAKFVEHTPHYVQSEIYRRQGVELSHAGALVRRGQRTAGGAVRPAAAVRTDAW